MIADIKDIVQDLRRGKMIVLVDDEERENEGDLLLPAGFVDAEAINFMATHGRGLVCLTLTMAHCEQLNLPLMTTNNRAVYSTNFTVSIEAATGVGTGISARDRAATVRAAAHSAATPRDIVSPGHVFPVRAADGGVLVRAGHTEAGCDLTRLAGLFPAAVICEIMKDDGQMARLEDLKRFAARHKLKIGTIKSLIEHRLQTENLVRRDGQFEVNTPFGRFSLAVFRDSVHEQLHLAFCRGDIAAESPTLVRVKSSPTILDGVLTEVPSRMWSAPEALRQIDAADKGILVLVAADGGGALKDQLRMLAQPPSPSMGSLRNYGIGAQILRAQGAGKIHLLSGRVKLPNMAAFGLHVEKIIEQ